MLALCMQQRPRRSPPVSAAVRRALLLLLLPAAAHSPAAAAGDPALPPIAAQQSCPSLTAMEAGKISPLITAADGTNYMLYLPSYWSAETKEPRQPTHPVLLFLHGAGGVQSEGNVRGISLGKMLADDGFMRANSTAGGSPVITAAPTVLPDGSIQSGTAPWPEGFPFITIMPIAAQRGWQPQFPNVAGLVEMVHRDLGGDPSRTYLAGQSMGGNGAWHLGAAYPSLFAAIVPVCGYIERNVDAPPKEVLEALATKPIWTFHSCVHR